MGPELLGIQPRELKFTFELKKQSSCSVQLVNNSDQYVAFKVKTTSPKRYCVRPNTGIIQPKSTCDFTVTMQAQRVAPPEMQCKDKFLIQSTIVPAGTIAEDITSSMFAKDSGKYIEENKLKVVFVSPPNTPILAPVNGSLKPEFEASTLRERVQSGVENFPPDMVAKGPEDLKHAKDVDLKATKDKEDLKEAKDVDLSSASDSEDLKQAKDVELKQYRYLEELKLARDMEESKLSKDVESKLTKDVEELKSNLKELESKLSDAEVTISKLKVERSTTNEEKHTLQQELALLRRNNGVRRVQVGYPFLFVCMVALVSVAIGYLLHP